MANLTITAASVIQGEAAVTEQMVAAVAITAGQVVFRDPVTFRAGLADNNSATVAVRRVRGIALNGAAVGQPVLVLRSGLITIGATLPRGVAFYLSDTPGGICPVADLLTGEFPVILGIAISTTVLNINVQASGVALI